MSAYDWHFYHDADADGYFIHGPHGTVAMVHRAEDGPLLASAPRLQRELDAARSRIAVLENLVAALSRKGKSA